MRVDRRRRKAAPTGSVRTSQDATVAERACGAHTGGGSLDTLLIADARERALGLPDRVLLAALEYVLRDRVTDAVVQGGRVAARILGARDEYRVEASLDPFLQIRCTCTLKPPCRHCAAAVVAYLRRPELFARVPESESALGDGLFSLAAGRPDPLASLRPSRGAEAAEEVREPDWAALVEAGGRSALDTLLRWLERATHGGQRPLSDDAATHAAETLGGLVGYAPRCGPELARRLVGIYLESADSVVAEALGAFLHAVEGNARQAARAATEHAVWAAADAQALRRDGSMEEGRGRRALDWLCDDAGAHGGEGDRLLTARAHTGLPGAAWHQAASLWRQGRVEEAAHVAQAAFLHARAGESQRLYALLCEMGRQGDAGVIAFLRAAWEADPDPARLDDLLSMGDEGARAEARRAAAAVLARRHRFDLLTALARRDDDVEAAVRWAVRDGAFAATPEDCQALADSVAPARPLLALELLGAAYRREGDPDRRRRIVARARAIERSNAELRQAWPVLRRRWFPEGGQPRPARPS
jgi:hypothetical protein